jgi:hypothetical protein
MDFIERIFHLSPDGGTGSLELAILLAVIAIPVTIVLLRRRRLDERTWLRRL